MMKSFRSTAVNPAEVIFKETPFYAESGGQIADTGIISNAHGAAEVDYVYKAPNGQNVHVIRVIEGVIQSGSYTLKVNSEKRRFVMKTTLQLT